VIRNSMKARCNFAVAQVVLKRSTAPALIALLNQ
jgi:hypothetical protein